MFSKIYNMDLAPIDHSDLQKDPTVIGYVDQKQEAIHTVNNGVLSITKISYSSQVESFIKKDLEKFLKKFKTRPVINDFNDNIRKLKFFNKNKDYIARLSTRRRLILLADIMSLCTATPESIKQRYVFLMPQGWDIYAFFASLISYNYAFDKEGTIQYPVHHKLIVLQLEKYFSQDVPTIYSTFLKIYEIENYVKNPNYKATSDHLFTEKELVDIKLCYEQPEEFKKMLEGLQMNCNPKNIIKTCEVVDNLSSLEKILSLIKQVQMFVVNIDGQAKQAIFGCLVQIGEYVKRLSTPLKQNTAYVNWQKYTILRDYLEHPDEAGRLAVIQNLSKDNVNFDRIADELRQLARHVIEIKLKFYNPPGLSFIKDVDNKLFKKTGKKELVLPNHLKVKAKDKKGFFEAIADDADYWSRAFKGQLLLSQEKVDKLNELKSRYPNLVATVDTLLQIDDLRLKHEKINKWAEKFALETDDLELLLDLTGQIQERDFWIKVLDQEQIVPDDKIDETLSAIQKTGTVHYDKVKEILIKIKPTHIQTILFTFDLHPQPNLDLQGIVALILEYLSLIENSLHDKLHDPGFVYSAGTKAAEYDFQNFRQAFSDMDGTVQKKLEDLQKKYPTIENLSEAEFKKAAKEYIEIGAYHYFEVKRKQSPQQIEEINEVYSKRYNDQIVDLLRADFKFCESLQYQFSVCFALIKKLLDQDKLIDKEITPLLESLKTIRNFLAHQDDYIAKIVNKHAHIHVETLGRSTYELKAYFSALEYKLKNNIDEPLLEFLEKQQNLEERNLYSSSLPFNFRNTSVSSLNNEANCT